MPNAIRAMAHPIYAAEFTMYAAVSYAPAHCSPHAHECFELLYILQGHCQIKSDNHTYQVGPHDLVIFKPYQIHEEFQISDIYALVCLRFPAEFISQHRVPFPEFATLPTVVALPQGDTFRAILDQVVAEYQGDDEYREAMIGTYLFQFAVFMRRALQQRPLAPTPHTQASYLQRLLDQHIGGSVSIRDLARKVHMSESHFSHQVKALLGVAPKQYLRDRMIDRARELLESTPMTIEQIAAALGYDEPTSFFRAFKRATGVTPGEVRKTQIFKQ